MMAGVDHTKIESAEPDVQSFEVLSESDEDQMFVVDLEGFEGPLDLLLALARKQKVDLTQISILSLAEQYLAFVARVRTLRLDVAADYLVMAAWLAYLKSRLLLPDEEDEDVPESDLMAEALQFRLRQLEAMRECAARLMARPQLGIDFFRCQTSGGIPVDTQYTWRTSLHQLLLAYADHSKRQSTGDWQPARLNLDSMQGALTRIERMVGKMPEWRSLLALLPSEFKQGLLYRSAVGSTLTASLELARTGKVELRQTEAFAPVEIRSRSPEQNQ